MQRLATARLFLLLHIVVLDRLAASKQRGSQSGRLMQVRQQQHTLDYPSQSGSQRRQSTSHSQEFPGLYQSSANLWTALSRDRRDDRSKLGRPRHLLAWWVASIYRLCKHSLLAPSQEPAGISFLEQSILCVLSSLPLICYTTS